MDAERQVWSVWRHPDFSHPKMLCAVISLMDDVPVIGADGRRLRWDRDRWLTEDEALEEIRQLMRDMAYKAYRLGPEEPRRSIPIVPYKLD